MAATAAWALTALKEALATDVPVVIDVVSSLENIDSAPTISGLRSR